MDIKQQVLTDLRERAAAVVKRHVAAEFTNDLSQILPTVTAGDVYFPSIALSDDGSYAVQVYEGASGARDFYAERLTMFDVLTAENVIHIVNDWYTIRCSVGTRRLKEGSGSDLDGLVVGGPTVVVFPVAPDGILGELPWAHEGVGHHVPLAQSDDAASVAPVVAQQLANMHIMTGFVDAWQRGDKEAISGALASNSLRICKTVDGGDLQGVDTRCTTGREAVVAALVGFVPRDLVVVSQFITDWFAVMEYRFSVTDERGSSRRRMVSLYPIEQGQVVGELSYAMAEADPSK